MRVIKVAFKRDVVELGKFLGKLASVLPLFEHILFFVPEPGREDFAEVLNNQAVLVNSFTTFTE